VPTAADLPGSRASRYEDDAASGWRPDGTCPHAAAPTPNDISTKSEPEGLKKGKLPPRPRRLGQQRLSLSRRPTKSTPRGIRPPRALYFPRRPQEFDTSRSSLTPRRSRRIGEGDIRCFLRIKTTAGCVQTTLPRRPDHPPEKYIMISRIAMPGIQGSRFSQSGAAGHSLKSIPLPCNSRVSSASFSGPIW